MFTLTTTILTAVVTALSPIPVDTAPAWGYDSVSEIDTSHYSAVFADFGGELLSYTSENTELPSLTVTKNLYEVRHASGVTNRIEIFDDGSISAFAG